MVFRRRWSHGAVQEERQHKATPRPRRLLALWRGRLLALAPPITDQVHFHAAEKLLSLIKSTGGKTRSCFQGFALSDANYFRTFDWEIPNCRAIRVGVMPGGANSIYLTARQRSFGDVHFFLMKGLGRGRPFVTKLAER
jgi:hypothetical protein